VFALGRLERHAEGSLRRVRQRSARLKSVNRVF
jgi:hypothetical protein